MEQDDRERSILLSALATVGRGLAAGGRFIGRRSAELYRSVDPDARRHLFQIPLFGFSTLLGGRQESVEPGVPDGHPPLIFVHGLGGNRGNFLLMAWYFWLNGRKRSYRIGFESGRSIGEHASVLARFVREVIRVTGEEQVEIVAHSMGGLSSRLAILEHDLAGSVRTLVTLGTPHQGTYPARFGNTVATRELRPDSELISRMSASSLPGSVRFVTFWSRSDLLILPPESAALPGSEQVDMTPFTHFSYLIAPKSWNAVREALVNRE